jgi:hypothetical protein
VPTSSNKQTNGAISHEHEDSSWSVVPSVICLTLFPTSPRTNISQESLCLHGLEPCFLNFAFRAWRATTLFRVRARACSRPETPILTTRFNDAPNLCNYSPNLVMLLAVATTKYGNFTDFRSLLSPQSLTSTLTRITTNKSTDKFT